MESSDDEDETLAQSVTDYHFVDDKDTPISFSVLPVQCCEGEKPKEVYLIGTAGAGIQKIYKQVIAWKFEFLDKHPEVSVLSKEKKWIKLLQPRTDFLDTVRTILLTLHYLHFAKKHPELSENSLWERMCQTFSSCEVMPCENDLLEHLPLIRDIIKQDETFSKSTFLGIFLEKLVKGEVFDEDAHTGLEPEENKCVVSDDEELKIAFGDNDGDISDEETRLIQKDAHTGLESEENTFVGGGDDEELEIAFGDNGDISDEETELFDSVCAFCDNGGQLLCCEGRCIRSFHATIDDGIDSDCKSLGFSMTQLKAMQTFLCLNCQHQRHQCFACGKLGSSDKSSNAEVFQCVSATCGYFYHPGCVAKLLHPRDEAEGEKVQNSISGGDSFTCPAHKCCICKQGENKDIPELQFAVCRRCPKAYHRKCLPRKICFDNVEDNLEDDGIATRAWDGLLANNRILIYCLKHQIDENFRTPMRNHIIFPQVEDEKKKRLSELLARKRKPVTERRFIDNEDYTNNKVDIKVPKYAFSYDVKYSGSTTNKEILFSGKKFNSSENPKIPDAFRKPFRDGNKDDKSSAIDRYKVSSGEERFTWLETSKPMDKKVTNRKLEGITKRAPPTKEQTTYELDANTKKRIMDMMKKNLALVTVEDIVKEHRISNTYAYSSLKTVVDRTITLGKVEGFTEAVRTALQKLEEGGTVEDAKAVCGTQIIPQIMKWKNKMAVYLSPFLHGSRYSSFGRHFTKVDKLKEIVDKLQWYIRNDDTIVDFCCGANDFSWLMKQRLEEAGKRCSFKNFDIIHPKNDFCFEKRDWMTVRPMELPTGSKLIMGLNPPFGVKAALANKFIDKALTFKPKLIILIVPPETERLDRKKEHEYDLIWEDDQKLAGKSFYLPGSLDMDNKQIEQWNNVTPVLYLWSRSDWTINHDAIALEQGHMSTKYKKSAVKENYTNQNRNSNGRGRELGHISKKHKKYPFKKVYSNQTIDCKAMALEQGHKSKEHNRSVLKDTYEEWQVSENYNEGQFSKKFKKDGIQHFQPDPCISGLVYRTKYNDMGTSTFESLDEVVKRYSLEGGSFASRGTEWSTDAQQGFDVLYPGDINESVGCYAETAFTKNARPRPPSNQLYVNDAVFGKGGSLASTPYKFPHSSSESNSVGQGSSSMQWYAPCVNDPDQTRLNSLGSQTPSRTCMFNSLDSQCSPGSCPSIQPNISGFLPRPPNPSSHEKPFGYWL